MLAAPSVVVLIVLLILPQVPPRDQAVVPTSGTATLSGVVMNDEAPPQPVRRAIVVLAGDGLRPSRGAVTDDEGRFSFTGLPAGRFTITASRASFVTSMFGATRPGRPGTAVAVGEGAGVTGVAVTLWRGAAVAGVIHDETGAPVAGVDVRALPSRGAGPLPTLSNNGASTNERGEFRIFGLEPGAYVVMARPSSGSASAYLALSESEMDAALNALRQRTAAPANGAAGNAPAPPQSFDYSPIYFPGTAVLSQAQEITLSAGQSQAGIDFSLQRVPTSVIEGVVMRPDGTPAGGASLQLTSTAQSVPYAGVPKTDLNTSAGPDGTFRIAQVTPGQYDLVARVPADPGAPGVRPGYIEAPSTSQLYAVTPVTVSGGNLTGIVLAVSAPAIISGRLVFEGAAPKPDLVRIRPILVPESMLPISARGFSPGDSLRAIAAGVVQPDGTFDLKNVAPGRYQLLLWSSDPVWSPVSAVCGDRDVLDGLVDIAPGTTTGTLVATYTDKATRLSGKLQSPTGAAVSDVFVLAFAADATLRGPYSRRVKAVRPSTDGSYAITGLPAGDYLLAAVTDVDPEDWQNPSFLEQLEPASIKLSLVSGGALTQDLRIGGRRN